MIVHCKGRPFIMLAEESGLVYLRPTICLLNLRSSLRILWNADFAAIDIQNVVWHATGLLVAFY
jgi:hypothetical protein